MLHYKRLSICAFVLLSLFVPSWVVDADMPKAFTIQGVHRIKQLTNYCGPATLAMVLRYYGLDVTQEEIGKVIYDRSSGATNGADMLLYSRERGFAAYSWNSSVNDVKKKLAAGFPVIVLQQNSLEDISGHYRVLTGYDDSTSAFSVLDPYYEITSMSYTECEKLWRRMGYWALLIVPSAKDSFKEELDNRNPVVHMDLSTAKFKRGKYQEALEEAKLALSLEPQNYYAQSMVNKIQIAMGAGAK